MTEPRCSSCKFFEKEDNPEIYYDGQCKKYAPRAFLFHSVNGDGWGYLPDALWPTVSKEQWCGEWSPQK